MKRVLSCRLLMASIVFHYGVQAFASDAPSPSTQVYSAKGPTAINNDSNEKALLANMPFNGSQTFAANSLNNGDTIILRNWGTLKTAANSNPGVDGKLLNPGPGTLTMRVMMGNVEICSTGAIALDGGVIGGAYEFYALFTVNGAGANATLQGGCRFGYGKAGALGKLFFGPATVNAVDTTAQQVFELKAKFSVADLNNDLESTAASVELLPSP